jgi:type III secretory pathway component EscV
MLGFGHGYLGIAEDIINNIKQMRKELYEKRGIEFPKIHIVDHDYDAEKNIESLQQNEFVIRIFGEEKVRAKCDIIQFDTIINKLREVIIENVNQLNTEGLEGE